MECKPSLQLNQLPLGLSQKILKALFFFFLNSDHLVELLKNELPGNVFAFDNDPKGGGHDEGVDLEGLTVMMETKCIEDVVFLYGKETKVIV